MHLIGRDIGVMTLCYSDASLFGVNADLCTIRACISLFSIHGVILQIQLCGNMYLFDLSA